MYKSLRAKKDGEAAFHESGFLLKRLLIEAAFHRSGFSSKRLFIKAAFHQSSFSSKQLFIKAAFHQICNGGSFSSNLVKGGSLKEKMSQ
jgi:hypothetical protein